MDELLTLAEMPQCRCRWAASQVVAAELERLAKRVDYIANVKRGNIRPDEGDDQFLEPGEVPEDYEPEYINRDQYYSLLSISSMLTSRAEELWGDDA